MTSRSKWNPVP